MADVSWKSSVCSWRTGLHIPESEKNLWTFPSPVLLLIGTIYNDLVDSQEILANQAQISKASWGGFKAYG